MNFLGFKGAELRAENGNLADEVKQKLDGAQESNQGVDEDQDSNESSTPEAHEEEHEQGDVQIEPGTDDRLSGGDGNVDVDSDGNGMLDSVTDAVGSGMSTWVVVVIAVAVAVAALAIGWWIGSRTGGAAATAPVAPPPPPPPPYQEAERGDLRAKDLIAALISLHDLGDGAAIRPRIVDELAQVGISVRYADPGTGFDPSWQQAVESRPAPEPGAVDTVAETVRPGWFAEDGPVRFTEVVVYT